MKIIYSDEFHRGMILVYAYGVETFGQTSAEQYRDFILSTVNRLDVFFLSYPECRWIPTKGRIYRNIILDSYLIIYRITDTRIEVLQIISSHRSISKIKAVRNIRIIE